MKKCLLHLSILVVFFLFSCQKEKMDVTLPEENTENGIRDKVEMHGPIETIVIEVSEDVIKRRSEIDEALTKSYAYYIKDTTINGKAAMIYEASEFSITGSFANAVYPGSILDGVNFRDGRCKPLSYPVDPIDVSYSLIARYVTDHIEVPSRKAAVQSCSDILFQNDLHTDQIAGFSYNMNQISYYDEVKLNFGFNINIGEIFNLGATGSNNRIQQESALTARFVQKNFTQDMDFPIDGCLLKEHSLLSKIPNAIYVSSVIYGREGTYLIESSSQFQELKLAFNAGFKFGIVNGSASVTNDQKALIEAATIQVVLVGNDGNHAAQVVNGFDKFREMIMAGGKYSVQVPGVPIAYRAAFLSDNSPVYTRIIVKVS